MNSCKSNTSSDVAALVRPQNAQFLTLSRLLQGVKTGGKVCIDVLTWFLSRPRQSERFRRICGAH